jgi:hypothetical protein
MEATKRGRNGGIVEYTELDNDAISDIVSRQDQTGRKILELANRGFPKGKIAREIGRTTGYLNQRYYSQREFRDCFYSLNDRYSQSLISIGTLAKRDAMTAYSKILELSQSLEVPSNIQLQASKDILDIAFPKGNEQPNVSIQSLLVQIAQNPEVFLAN